MNLGLQKYMDQKKTEVVKNSFKMQNSDCQLTNLKILNCFNHSFAKKVLKNYKTINILSPSYTYVQNQTSMGSFKKYVTREPKNVNQNNDAKGHSG